MIARPPLSQIETPTESFVARYPWATEMAIEQQSIFWPAEELGVELDEQDFRIGLNDAERHGVLTAQSIITKMEGMIGGDEMWGGKIARLFPRPEIQRMCACFANVELNSHAPFYRIGNEVMGNHTDEFYASWQNDPVMSETVAYINRLTDTDDALKLTAALAFLEGAKLFVILGFFKGFNARGFNLIPHFVSGIDGSAKDENYHSIASARLFRECKAERIAAGNHGAEADYDLNQYITDLAYAIRAFERRTIDLLFQIPGNRVVTKEELLHFSDDRIDVVLHRLERPVLVGGDKGEISKWFYQQLSTVKLPDFFVTTQLQYRRNWAKHRLGFKRELVNA